MTGVSYVTNLRRIIANCIFPSTLQSFYYFKQLSAPCFDLCSGAALCSFHLSLLKTAIFSTKALSGALHAQQQAADKVCNKNSASKKADFCLKSRWRVKRNWKQSDQTLQGKNMSVSCLQLDVLTPKSLKISCFKSLLMCCMWQLMSLFKVQLWPGIRQSEESQHQAEVWVVGWVKHGKTGLRFPCVDKSQHGLVFYSSYVT